MKPRTLDVVAVVALLLLPVVVVLLVGSDRLACGQGGPTGGTEPLLAASTPSDQRQSDALARADWAIPMQCPGLSNFYKVSGDLYRGAQPTAEGFRELAAAGVRTVVNLRSLHSDRDEMGDVALGYEHIGMQAWQPEDDEVARFLTIMCDPQKLPVFVHCHYGADRTGVMCAVYRMAIQGWTPQAAADEMVEGRFGFHKIWRPLLEDYVCSLDVEAMRQGAGLTSEPFGPTQ